jgi:arabinosyltransferase A/arabinosyltransferase B/arabinosyltransferase C
MIGLLCLVCLLGVFLVVRAMDTTERPSPPRLLPTEWWRPRFVDAAVAAGLGLWLLIGPTTVDDGWSASRIRGITTNGFVGNVYQWMNAPEAPFSWFFRVYHRWSAVSTSTLWFRIPSTMIAVMTWFLLSRALLPRLGSFAKRRSILWLAAAMFGAWWLPFNLGLRPEPWIALGSLVVLVAVDRGISTGRVLPLLIGLVIAAAATTTAPQGTMAFAPYLVMLLPVVRVLRARVDLRWIPAGLLLVAASATGLLFAFAGQSYATVSEANRVRRVIGGGSAPWYREVERYYALLNPENFQGALQRRVPVLLGLFALGWLAWMLSKRVDGGIDRRVATLVTGTFGASLVALVFSPTKWTYHFGALAGVGTVLLVVSTQAWTRRGIAVAAGRPPGLRVLWISTTGIAVMVMIGGLVLGGRNEWPGLPDIGVTWSTHLPRLLGHSAATLVPIAAALLAGALAAIAVWHTAVGTAQPPSLRWLPSPAVLAVLLVVASVVLQFTTVGWAAIKRRHTYTLAHDSIDTLRRGSCGLGDYLLVEPDPEAGMLSGITNSQPPRLEGFVADSAAVTMAGMQLPGWTSTSAHNKAGDGPATATTGWFQLPKTVRTGARPLVVAVAGRLEGRNKLMAEFGRITPGEVTTIRTKALEDTAGAPAARDLRIDVPAVAPGAEAARVVGIYGGTDISLAFTPPRAPHTEPLASLLPHHSAALLDWPLAFWFPCLQMAALRDGAAQLPRWRLAPPRFDDSGAIMIEPKSGGPFATTRMLVRQEQVPIYLVGDMLRDVITLYRWTPITRFASPSIHVRDETVSGFKRAGPITVPGVNTAWPRY